MAANAQQCQPHFFLASLVAIGKQEVTLEDI